MISNLQAEYHTKAFQLFMELFKNHLDSNHEKLDVAIGDEILKLQGENRYIKQLLKIKEYRELKYTKQDGGFGVS